MQRLVLCRSAPSVALRELVEPVPGDLVSAGQPSSASVVHVAQHPLQPGNPPGPADHAQVQPDGQHPTAFLPKLVEGVVHVLSEVRRSREFHLLLAAVAGNPFVRGFVERLASTTSLAVLLLDQSDVPSCAVEEHRLLVRLIEAGDGDAAALMARHLGHNQDRLRGAER